METSCNPVLVTDLLDHLLAVAIRSTQVITPADISQHLVGPLNVVARKYTPLTTLTAISKIPWIDMHYAASRGDLWLLDTLVKLSRPPYHRPLQYVYHDVMELCATRGHVHVLEWWQAHGFPCNSVLVADNATENGHIGALEWCLRLQKRVHISSYGTRMASLNGRVHVLEWLVEHENAKLMPFAHDGARDMAAALIRGDLAVADWWLKSGRLSSIVFKKSVVDVSAELAGVDFKTQPHRYREHVICRILDSSIVQEMAIAACATDDLDLIRLCYRASASGDDHHGSNIDANAIPLSYLFASAAGHVPILDDLLARHGYPPAQFNNLSSLASSFAVELVPCILRTLPANWRNLTRAADMASAMNHVHVLEWWLTHVGPDQLHYSSLAVDMANRHGHLDVIHFWHRLAMDHGCEWRYSPETLVEAGRLARLDVLDWWINKCPVYMTFQFQPAFAAACNVGQVKVLDWCAAQMSLQWTMERIKPIVAKCGHWDTIKWYLDRGGTIADPVSLVARAWPQAMHLLLGCLAYNLSVRPLTQDEVGDVLWRGQSLFLALCIRHNLLPVVVDLDAAVTECAIAALDVLVASKYPVRYTPQAMQSATWSEDCVALDWWVGSGLKLKPPAKEQSRRYCRICRRLMGQRTRAGEMGHRRLLSGGRDIGIC